ncbi:hypothetical protein NC651_013199 [Populus alba x Populus x berolinensis]|nr:hypothetical protein NC651_013199 [Populus alba x Populus x berolinensis]
MKNKLIAAGAFQQVQTPRFTYSLHPYWHAQHIVFNDRQTGVVYLFRTEARPRYFSPSFPDHLTFQQLVGSAFTHEENTSLYTTPCLVSAIMATGRRIEKAFEFKNRNHKDKSP